MQGGKEGRSAYRELAAVEALTISAAAEQSPDLVVVAEEGNKKLCASVLKYKPKIAVTTALEELAS